MSGTGGTSPGQPPSGRPAPRQRLAAAWDRFAGLMQERVRTLEELAAALTTAGAEEPARRPARQAAHALAGTLGSFGLVTAGEEARRVEDILAGEAPLSSEGAHTLAQAVGRIRQAIEQGPKAPTPDGLPAVELAGLPADGVDVVLIVDDDLALAEHIAAEASVLGIATRIATSVGEARRIVASERPTAVVVDLLFPDEPDEAYRFLEEISSLHPPVPAIVYTVRDSFTDRVEAARRGAKAFLEKPVPPALVLDALTRMVEAEGTSDVTVLVLDDDPVVQETLRLLLAPRLRLAIVGEPVRFWSVLEETDPDLVVLDLNLPGVDGLELCRVLRADPRWADLPIMVLTSRAGPGVAEEVFAAGADDYVRKPIEGPELIARVKARSERIRALKRAGEMDELTGIANRRRAKELLDRYLRLARRSDAPLTLALLDIDRMKAVNDTHGHLMGDRALRLVAHMLQAAFRGEDVVARWGGEEFVVAMYGGEKPDGVRRLDAVLADLLAHPIRVEDGDPVVVSFSAGVASFPDDGETFQALYQAADEALYRAKAAGRRRIFQAGDDEA